MTTTRADALDEAAKVCEDKCRELRAEGDRLKAMDIRSLAVSA